MYKDLISVKTAEGGILDIHYLEKIASWLEESCSYDIKDCILCRKSGWDISESICGARHLIRVQCQNCDHATLLEDPKI